jgi:hypothetical protein
MGIIALAVTQDSTLVPVAGASLSLCAGLLVGFLMLLSTRVKRLVGRVVRAIPPLSPVEATMRRVSDAFLRYRAHVGALALAGVASFGIQCLTSVVNWLAGESLSLGIPFVYFFLFNPLVAFLLLFPISINGIGVKQAIYVFFYSTLIGRASPEQAFAMSALMQAIIIVSGLLGGLAWLQVRAQSGSRAVGQAAGR